MYETHKSVLWRADRARHGEPLRPRTLAIITSHLRASKARRLANYGRAGGLIADDVAYEVREQLFYRWYDVFRVGSIRSIKADRTVLERDITTYIAWYLVSSRIPM